MGESEAHKRAKKKAAGKTGKTEVPISGKRKLDASTKIKAIEIERSGNLKAAAERLKASRKPQKVLQVPEKDLKKAVEAMKKAGISGTVKNMSGTKIVNVRKPKRKK